MLIVKYMQVQNVRQIMYIKTGPYFSVFSGSHYEGYTFFQFSINKCIFLSFIFLKPIDKGVLVILFSKGRIKIHVEMVLKSENELNIDVSIFHWCPYCKLRLLHFFFFFFGGGGGGGGGVPIDIIF